MSHPRDIFVPYSTSTLLLQPSMEIPIHFLQLTLPLEQILFCLSRISRPMDPILLDYIRFLYWFDDASTEQPLCSRRETDVKLSERSCCEGVRARFR
jgi:hypothetical protein